MDITERGKGEAVLRLRSLRSSGDFEEYWSFHQHHELVRNHQTRFSCTGRKRKTG
jgi:hypothetical protein